MVTKNTAPSPGTPWLLLTQLGRQTVLTKVIKLSQLILHVLNSITSSMIPTKNCGVVKEELDGTVEALMNIMRINTKLTIGLEILTDASNLAPQLEQTAWRVNTKTTSIASLQGSVSITATCVMDTPTPSVGVMTRSWMIATRPNMTGES